MDKLIFLGSPPTTMKHKILKNPHRFQISLKSLRIIEYFRVRIRVELKQNPGKKDGWTIHRPIRRQKSAQADKQSRKKPKKNAQDPS